MSPASVPWQLPVIASLLVPTILLASGRVRELPRVFVATALIAAQNIGLAIAAEFGPNLELGVVLIPVNLGVWLWAVAPWLERRVLYQGAFAALAEMVAVFYALATDAMTQLAVAMPVQAMLLAAVGGAVLVNAECRPAPGCRAVGTFLVFYFGVTALVWPVATNAGPSELFWLFTVRALVHTVAYGRLTWELARETEQRKAVAA